MSCSGLVLLLKLLKHTKIFLQEGEFTKTSVQLSSIKTTIWLCYGCLLIEMGFSLALNPGSSVKKNSLQECRNICSESETSTLNKCGIWEKDISLSKVPEQSYTQFP